jgi:hypothetical protein
VVLRADFSAGTTRIRQAAGLDVPHSSSPSASGFGPPATDHIGVRGEYRFDQDGHEGFTRSDSEWTVGVFWTL